MTLIFCAPTDYKTKENILLDHIDSLLNTNSMRVELPDVHYKSFDDLLKAAEKLTKIKETSNFLLTNLIKQEKEVKNNFRGHFSYKQYLKTFNWNSQSYGRSIEPLSLIKEYEQSIKLTNKMFNNKNIEYNNINNELKSIKNKINGNISQIDISVLEEQQENEYMFIEYVYVYVQKEQKEKFENYVMHNEYLIMESIETVKEDSELFLFKVLCAKSKLAVIQSELKSNPDFKIKLREFNNKQDLFDYDQELEKKYYEIKQNFGVFLDANIVEVLNLCFHIEMAKFLTENVLKYGVYKNTEIFIISMEIKEHKKVKLLHKEWKFSTDEEFKRLKVSDGSFYAYLDYAEYFKADADL